MTVRLGPLQKQMLANMAASPHRWLLVSYERKPAAERLVGRGLLRSRPIRRGDLGGGAAAFWAMVLVGDRMYGLTVAGRVAAKKEDVNG